MKSTIVSFLTCLVVTAAMAQTGTGGTSGGAAGAGAAGAGNTGQGTVSGSSGINSGVGSGAVNNGSTVDRSGLPPGLQNRQELPPGLARRDQLPPGLAGRTNNNPIGLTQLTNQAGSTPNPSLDTAGNTSSAVTSGQGQGTATNTGNYGQLGGGVLGGTIQSGTLNNRFGTNNGLTPTSDRPGTTNVYATNSMTTSVTNTGGSTNTITMRQDIAITREDRVVLTQIRRQIAPVLTQIATVQPGSTSPYMPVHLAVRQGVVTVAGFVPTVEESQRVVTLVESVPGVVRVVNELRISTETGGSTVSRTTDTSTSGGLTSTTTNQSTTTDQTGSGVVSTTNAYGNDLTPTSDRTNTGGRVYNNTNAAGAWTNRAGADTNRGDMSTNRSGLPPGLQKREQLPPGLEKRDTLPPGLQRRQGSSSTNTNR